MEDPEERRRCNRGSRNGGKSAHKYSRHVNGGQSTQLVSCCSTGKEKGEFPGRDSNPQLTDNLSDYHLLCIEVCRATFAPPGNCTATRAVLVIGKHLQYKAQATSVRSEYHHTFGLRQTSSNLT